MALLLLTTSAEEKSITHRDYPRCARCHMPVEEFTVFDEQDGITFVAACHGKRQVVKVPDVVLTDMFGSRLDIGLAFTEDADGYE